MFAVDPEKRWELFRLLGERTRLRVLALLSAEEMSIGELAEALAESSPNVSRHVKTLRSLGVLTERRDGTRVYVRTDAHGDPVVLDACKTGLSLCEHDGSLSRARAVVRARDDSRSFFEGERGGGAQPWPSEMAAYLAALAPLIDKRDFAIDVGTGDGSLLEVLAPVFERILAVDRSTAQLERAHGRLARRGYNNVELRQGDIEELAERELGADVVFASRVLHHAAKPAAALQALANMVRPGGHVIVIDYLAHSDESMRDLADVWLGFDAEDFKRFARAAGLCDVHVTELRSCLSGDGADGHLPWMIGSARRAQLNE